MKKYYITFGQKYRSEKHPKYHKANADGYVTINAPDAGTARKMAFEHLGEYWSMLYSSEPSKEFFPAGEIEEWTYDAG